MLDFFRTGPGWFILISGLANTSYQPIDEVKYFMLFGTQKINTKGHLEIGGCDTVELAREYGTPLYVMDESLIRQNCRDFLGSFRAGYPDTIITFAGKAFLTTAMCRIIEEEGLYLDAASAGEAYTAIKANFPMERVIFHGNFKTEEELRMALDYSFGRVVVDNIPELEQLNAMAVKAGRKADILLRLTPGIDPNTHRLISTGQADTKFGMNIEDGTAMKAIRLALDSEGVTLRGIHCHVGSQILDTDAHTSAAGIIVKVAKDIYEETGIAVEEIDMGGGLGIKYISAHQPPKISEFAADVTGAFKKALEENNLPNRPRLIQEPGRSITGPAGVTLYSVGAVKTVPISEAPGTRTYVTVDGGLSDNPRPLLYEAVYEAALANRMNEPASETVTISGRHCETDTLIQDTKIAKPSFGDLLAVYSTGAYNFSMASNYNRFPRPAVVLVANGRSALIEKRESLDDLIKNDIIPDKFPSAG